MNKSLRNILLVAEGLLVGYVIYVNYQVDKGTKEISKTEELFKGGF